MVSLSDRKQTFEIIDPFQTQSPSNHYPLVTHDMTSTPRIKPKLYCSSRQDKQQDAKTEEYL